MSQKFSTDQNAFAINEEIEQNQLTPEDKKTRARPSPNPDRRHPTPNFQRLSKMLQKAQRPRRSPLQTLLFWGAMALGAVFVLSNLLAGRWGVAVAIGLVAGECTEY